MTAGSTRLVRGVFLLGLALAIGKLLLRGEMVKYMAPALDPLSAVTGVVLALMGALELGAGLRPARGRRDMGRDPDHASAGGIEELLTALLLLLVLGVGFLVAPRALGSSGLGGERVPGLLLRFAPGSGHPPGSAALARAGALEDLVAVLGYLRDVGEGGVGQPVRIVGTVARSDDLPPREFALLRYSIVHCVADARPVALLVVVAPGPGAAEWPGDQWVEVEGVLAVRERDGDRLVTLEARTIRAIEEPANPYLFVAF